MSFHKNGLITFVIFHIVATSGGVLADKLQTHPEPTNDRDMIAQGVGLYVWVLFTLLMSLIGLCVACFFRGIEKFIGRVRMREQVLMMAVAQKNIAIGCFETNSAKRFTHEK